MTFNEQSDSRREVLCNVASHGNGNFPRKIICLIGNGRPRLLKSIENPSDFLQKKMPAFGYQKFVWQMVKEFDVDFAFKFFELYGQRGESNS